MNVGIEVSKSPFVARMDSDDVAHPERLEIQLAFMENNPNVAVCGSALEVYENPGVYWIPPQSHEEIVARQLFENPIFHPTVMFRNYKEYHNTIKYDESFDKAQDYELWTRLSKDSKYLFANLPQVLLKYRTHPNKNRNCYKQKQSTSADIVRQRILTDLGVSFSKEEYGLHRLLYLWPRILDRQTLSRCSEWLTCLNTANASRKIYENNALKAELKMRWKKLCLHVSDSLAVTPFIFLKSEWGKGSLCNLVDAGRMVYRNIKNKIGI